MSYLAVGSAAGDRRAVAVKAWREAGKSGFPPALWEDAYDAWHRSGEAGLPPPGWKKGDPIRRDFRTGAAPSAARDRDRQRMAAMEERRIGRPDLFVGDRPEMVARREAAEQQRLEMEGGTATATGGIPTMYLLIGGAALVGLFVYMKKRKK